MCTSPSTAFAWVGAVLVNVGFVTLITWGAATVWPLGFVLSFLYTASLFAMAHWLDRQDGDYQPVMTNAAGGGGLNLGTIVDEAEQQEERGCPRGGGSTSSTESGELLSSSPSSTATISIRVPVIVSLLYGLAVISLGVTGFFLPVNLFPANCNDNGDDNGSYWHPQWTWTTNVTDLPRDVQQWARTDYSYTQSAATFGYIATADVTLFWGSASSSQSPCLWSITASTPPVQHNEFVNPADFVTPSDETVCFLASDKIDSMISRRLYCSNDGATFRSAKDPMKHDHSNVYNLIASSSGLVWFKESPTSQDESGRLIYSMDPTTMVMSLRSQRVQAPDHDDSSCQTSRQIRKQALLAIFTTALPVTLTSIALWKMKQIPSMAVTTYLGLTLMYVSVLVAIDPQHHDETTPLKWWFAITGLIWLLVLSDRIVLLAADDDEVRRGSSSSRDPLRWGLIVGGTAFLGGMMSVLLVGDQFWHWLLLNLLAFVPLIVFGAATETVFLMFLGAFGFLIDSGRFAMFAGDHVTGQATVPIQFLVFAVTGLIIGALGFQLSKYQNRVRVCAVTLVQYMDNAWMNHSNNRRRNLVQEVDDESVNALLPPSVEET